MAGLRGRGGVIQSGGTSPGPLREERHVGRHTALGALAPAHPRFPALRLHPARGRTAPPADARRGRRPGARGRDVGGAAHVVAGTAWRLLAGTAGFRRRRAERAGPAAAGRDGHARHALVPGDDAELRAAHAALQWRRAGAAGRDRARPATGLLARRAAGGRGPLRGGAAPRRRAGRRPGGGVPAERARDGDRDAGGGQSRGGVVVVLAGLRRTGRARPLRADRADGALRGRRLHLQRQAAQPAGARACAGRRAAGAAAAGAGALPRPGRNAGGPRGHGGMHVGRVPRRGRPPAIDFRRGAVCAPALHHVLVGHDRRAEVHRARPRRHAAAAHEGVDAAHGRAGGRPGVLLHDLRLDDVELAGQRAGGGGGGGAVRGQPAAPAGYTAR